MKTKMSSKGQIVLPAATRRRLGLVPGVELEVEVAGDRLVLTPRHPRRARFAAGRDAVSGLPTLKATGKSPASLTSKQVAELMVEFP